MRQEPPTGCAFRIVPAHTEHHMLPHSVGKRFYGPGRVGSPAVLVNTHMGEIMPKARLHIGPRFAVQRLARRAQNFVNNRRGGPRACWGKGPSLQGFFLSFFSLPALTPP